MGSPSEAPDPVFVFRGARSPVMSVTFLKNNEDDSTRYLAAGTQEGKVLVWDLKTKTLFREWFAYEESSVLWIYSRMGGEIWTLGRHKSVNSWNITNSVPQTLKQYSLEKYLGFSQCDISEVGDGIFIAIPGPEQEDVSVYDTEKDCRVCVLSPQDPRKYGTMMHMRWFNGTEKSVLVVLYESGHISVWDYTSINIVSEIQCSETPVCMSVSSVSGKVLIGTVSENLFSFVIDGSLDIGLEKELSVINPGIACCIARPDGKLFAVGGWDFRIRLFSSKKIKPLAVLLYHKKTVECLAYSAFQVKEFNCQYLLAAGSSDMSVSLWKLFE